MSATVDDVIVLEAMCVQAADSEVPRDPWCIQLVVATTALACCTRYAPQTSDAIRKHA